MHAAEQLAFLLHFLFWRDQKHNCNLTSKIMKKCEQILKKTAPQYNSNSLNCKKLRSNESENDVTHALQLKWHERTNIN